MKKSSDNVQDFPEEEVRSAIQAGIVKAKGEIIASPLKKTRAKRKITYAFCSVAAVFVLLIGSSYYSPALANSLSQIPLIGSIFGDSDLIGLQIAHKDGLTSEIGETQTKNGISVTLKEILYDQNDISIGLIIESQEELDDLYFGAGMDFTIDGKRPKTSTGSYGEEILSPTTRTAIQEINITDELPESFNLGLVLRGEKGEKWRFSTPVEKIASIHKIAVNHNQIVDGVELSVTELAISQTGMSLTYESSEKGTDFDRSRGGYIEFRVTDQDGNEIDGRFGGVTGELIKDRIVFKSNKKFDPLPADVTELTITPYLVIPTAGGGVEINEDGEETKLDWKGDEIEPLEFEAFTVQLMQ